MNFISKNEALHAYKPEGTKVDYYLRDTFNETDKVVKFIVVKLVPIGKNKREVIENDKIVN
jgi:hypothetical protein